MKLRQQLIHAMRGSFVLRVMSLSSAMIGSVVLARALGPDAFGVYSYVFAIISLLALPSQVGIPTLLVRETAKAHVMENWSVMKGLWHWATLVIVKTSAVIALSAAFVLWLKHDDLADSFFWTMIVGLILIPTVALGNARGAALQGLRLVVRGLLPDAVIRPFLLIFLVVILWVMSGSVTSSQAMILHAIAASVAFIVGAVVLWKSKPDGLDLALPDYSCSRQWWHAALPLALVSGLQVVSNQASIVLLGMMRPESDVAFYKVATSASSMSLFGMQIVNLVAAPHVARMHAVSDTVLLQRLASLGAVVSATVASIVLCIFLLYGKTILSVVYGAEYIHAFWPMIILTIGQLANASFGIVGLLLGMTGLEKKAAAWLSVSTGVNVIFSAVLIPILGMNGAAVAVALSLAVWNIAFWRIARRNVSVDGSIFYAFRLAALHFKNYYSHK